MLSVGDSVFVRTRLSGVCLGLAALGHLALLSCSSDEGQSSGDPSALGQPQPGADSSTAPGDGLAPLSDGSSEDSQGSTGQGQLIADDPGGQSEQVPGNAAECAAQTQEAALAPVHLLFLLDQSGSMGDGEHGDRTLKWDPLATALKSFFSAQDSVGLSAALTMFPPDLNQGTGAAASKFSDGQECDASSYQAPEVPLTQLPSPITFGEHIDRATPPNEWGTPTQPALAGVIAQAEKLLTDSPDAKVAIVLVTDGEPAQCDQNSVKGTAQIAADVAARIPTYVVGVGNKLDALNTIAEGGGTDAAVIVAIDDPVQTQQTLIDTFNGIRDQVVACDAAIPEPPAGRVFEREKVAVELTLSDGSISPVSYDGDCATGAGWRYDDPTAPTAIQLCEQTCGSLKQQTAGALNVVFGCKVVLKLTK